MINNHKISLWSVLALVLLMMTACEQVDNPAPDENTFQNSIRLVGHNFDILQDNSGLAVDVRWTVLDELASDSLVTYAVVFNETDETTPVMEDATVVTLPAIGDEVRVTYNLVADTVVLPQGTYTVNLGWYYDTDPVQYLTINYGTAEQEQYLRLFDFAVDGAGVISPTAFTIDSSDG